MSLALLVDALVRETASLIATVATHKGARTPLSQVGDRLFYGLAAELSSQSVRRRVSADMFGMVPRAYIRKVRRVEESATERGRSLWEAVYEFIVQKEAVTLSEIGQRFHRDDNDVLRGVLSDLRETGMVVVSGRGAAAQYRAATSPEIGARIGRDGLGTDELVWAMIYREGPISTGDLQRVGGLRPQELEVVIERLLRSGRIESEEAASETLYKSAGFSTKDGDAHAWEGAIFDHFHAVVKTLTTFLTGSSRGASAASTYTFDLAPGHPLAEQVEALFSDMRQRATELRKRIDEYNVEQGIVDTQRTILYLGLCRDDSRKSVRPPPADDD